MYQGRIWCLYQSMRGYSAVMPQMTLTEAVAAELKQLRKSLNLTQKDLAGLTGIPEVSIQRYEAGKTINIEDLGRMVFALGGDPADVFARATARMHEND